MKKQLALFAAIITTSPLSFAAPLNPINQDQFKQAFADKTFTAMSTAQINGKEIDNRVTVYMDNKDKIQGKFALQPAQGPQTDQGIYSIKNDGMVCITWQHWFNSKEECVYAYNTQNAYIMVDTNTIFHFSIMKFSIKPGNQMSKKI